MAFWSNRWRESHVFFNWLWCDLGKKFGHTHTSAKEAIILEAPEQTTKIELLKVIGVVTFHFFQLLLL